MPTGIYDRTISVRKKMSKEVIEKITKHLPRFKGNKHPLWKGSSVGYRGLHYWISRELGKPNICETCRNTKLKPRQYHWANISKEYKRELTDWIRLCAKCHFIYDNKKIPSRWNK